MRKASKDALKKVLDLREEEMELQDAKTKLADEQTSVESRRRTVDSKIAVNEAALREAEKELVATLTADPDARDEAYGKAKV